ncbi:MerR family transcriptional regulator [Paenibacillus medicaginis]|uniref:MerR family transcriptional regulator n=1 Tax=Paenibacillus medicaginis TaxID=1470560 RepID=A0ABV5BU42_9BACL
MNSYTMKEMMYLCDTTEDALRYYEKIGLLTQIQRKKNRHRIYNDQDKEIILVIKCLRKTGMSLEEIRPFLGLYRDNNMVMDEEMREMLRCYQEKIKRQQSDLQKIWETIEYKLQSGEPLSVIPASKR